jgi:membrane protein implicated in regulation of membrane protease activity
VFKAFNQAGYKNLAPTQGVIDKVICQGVEWRVRVNGSYWSAYALSRSNFFPGDLIQVVDRQNQKLLIEAVSSDEKSMQAAVIQ